MQKTPGRLSSGSVFDAYQEERGGGGGGGVHLENAFGPRLSGFVIYDGGGASTVDLGFLRFVTAIGTQGAISKETKKHYYVGSYKLDLSSNGEDWVTVKEGSKQKVAQPSGPSCG
ncbi:Neuropilin-1 [Liparis tanakae]|uniref:Neuropilin-1 n=1 Tax=Liparis tanakae TaxID=230148 RepID=A0A4Z2G3F5_9TELE|nr:Neuropilin-1 [Liparis tanakae]